MRTLRLSLIVAASCLLLCSTAFAQVPTFVSITRNTPLEQVVPVATTEVIFQVNFNENKDGVVGPGYSVNNVDTADFVLVLDGVTATIASVAAGPGQSKHWTVTVNGISGDGTLGLALAGGHTINLDPGGEAIAGEMIAEETYLIAQNRPIVLTNETADLTYIAGSGAASVFPNVAVGAGPNPPIASATVTITSTAYTGTEDQLAVPADTPSVLAGRVGVAYNEDTRVLTLTNLDAATQADFQEVLRAMTYENTSSDPDTNTRTMTIVATDSATTPMSSYAASRDVLIDNPPDAVDDAAGFVEDSAGGGIDVLANDSDPDGDTLTIISVDSPTARGCTVTNNGTSVTYTPAPNVVGEDTFTYTISDGKGGTDTATVTVTLAESGINDPPQGADATIGILEDGSHTFAAGDFSFSDPGDLPNNLFYRVQIVTLPTVGTLLLDGVAVVANDFIEVTDLGLLVYTPAANGSGATYATLGFLVQDNGGTAGGGIDIDQTERTLTFNVTEVNDEPAGTDNSKTILEDATYTFAAADFGFTDPNDSPADALASVIITTVPGEGTLELDSVTVEAGDEIAVGDIATLVYVPAANYNGETSFTFQVVDDGGTAETGAQDTDQSANTFTITVTSVNDEPAGTDKNVDLYENDSYVFDQLDFGFTDPSDNPADAFKSVIITTLPGNGSIDLNSSAVTAGQTVAVADIANLTYTPDTDYVGEDSFTFQVVDDGGTVETGAQDTDQSANIFTFNMATPNKAPSFTKGGDQVVLEDSGAQTVTGWATNISAGEGEGDQTVDFIVDVDYPDLFSASPAIDAAGELTYTPAANAAGSTTVYVRIHDDGGTGGGGIDTSAEQTFTITLTPVNDEPVGTDGEVTIDEDAAHVFVAADFGFTDPNDSPVNALVDIKMTTIPGPGTLLLDGVAVTVGQVVSKVDIDDGKLTFVPVATASGTPYASFTFQVRDDGGTANSGVDLDATPNTLTINVTDINDTPVAEDQSVSVDKNGSVVIVLTGSDEETAAGSLVYSIVDEPVNGTLTLDFPNVTYEPTSKYEGPDSFTFRVYDGNSFSEPATVTITVGSSRRGFFFGGGSDDGGCMMSAAPRSWDATIAWYIPFLMLCGFLVWSRWRHQAE